MVMLPVPSESAGSRARLDLAIHRVQFTIGHKTAVHQPTQARLIGISRDDMDMKMENLLPCHLTCRGQHIDPVRSHSVHEQPCDSFYGWSDFGKRASSVDHVLHMPLRDHQGVATMPGTDVEKGDRPIVGIYPSGRHLSGNDLAKDAIGIKSLRFRRLERRHVMMFSSSWPAANRRSWAAIKRSARGKKAVLAPPTCGEINTPGVRQSGCSGGSGSGSVTSMAALILPVDVSASSASVSTSLPRAMLTSTAPSRKAASSSFPIMPSVCAVCGATTKITSALRSNSGNSSMLCTRTGSVRGRRATRVTDAISKPASRRSMAAPMWPYPMINTR